MMHETDEAGRRRGLSGRAFFHAMRQNENAASPAARCAAALPADGKGAAFSMTKRSFPVSEACAKPSRTCVKEGLRIPEQYGTLAL